MGGVPITKYEKQIYNMVNTSCEHMTAEQVYEALKRIYPRVSLATVYNNLNKLCDTNLIRRVSVDGFTDRYDRMVRHDHLICRRCGRLSDLTLDDLTASLQGQLEADFLYYDLKIFYICPACRKNSRDKDAVPE